jgi:uncharacterized membrane protein (UPF0136 family)
MKTGQWMVCYGLFLVAMGITGYASNPEKARTALMSGGVFGALAMLWGWLMSRGIGWSGWAATATVGMLTVVFAWRATVSWSAYADGAAGKLAAATLITLMGGASLAMLGLLIRHLSRPGRPSLPVNA